jgi:uncharacterized protein involved in exopolysaccharide biosynthesis
VIATRIAVNLAVLNQGSRVNRSIAVDYFPLLSIADLIRLSLRYYKSAVLTTIVVAALLFAVVMVIPSKYDSESQILVRLGRGSVAMDTTSDLTQNLSLQESRLSHVSSIREMLQSRALASRVVASVGADEILLPRSSVERTFESMCSLVPSLGGGGAGGERTPEQMEAIKRNEGACKALFDAMVISSPKDAYTIFMRIRTGDPDLSTKIMEAYLDEYKTLHSEAFRSTNPLEFCEEQLALAESKATPQRFLLLLVSSVFALMFGVGQSVLRALVSSSRSTNSSRANSRFMVDSARRYDPARSFGPSVLRRLARACPNVAHILSKPNTPPTTLDMQHGF